MVKEYVTISILGILLLVSLIVVFILLWKFKANPDFIPELTRGINTHQIGEGQTQELTWREELAKWPSKDFIPAVEQSTLHFDADTSELKEKNRYCQLVVNKHDIYSMPCLRQTLSSSNVKYFLLKSDENPEIFSDTDNKNLIDDIIKELKEYKINTETKET